MGVQGVKRNRAFTPPEAPEGAAWVNLGEGIFALIDAADVQLVAGRTWFAHRAMTQKHYAANASNSRRPAGTPKWTFLHNVILPSPPGFETDHIDGDTLNNRRSNLRSATRSQNVANARKPRRPGVASSQYKGVVTLRGRNLKWRAGIGVRGQRIDLGCFETEEAAARAYDEAAREHFGVFATVNFPRVGERAAVTL